ncbi:MAG: type-F conjugative transfer system secretin TraK, partial [Betaproteobacteria bacterium]
MPRRDSRPLRRRLAAPTATVAMAPGSQTPRWFRSVAAWAGLTGLLAAASPATALQVLDARDGVAVEAVLSIKEPTRIRIDGAAITDVFGNIHSSNCGPAAPSSSGSSGAPPAATLPAENPAGEIGLECDRDKGEIYIRPVGDAPKPVNLF